MEELGGGETTAQGGDGPRACSRPAPVALVRTPRTPALWTKHRKLAYGIASEFRIPGLGAEDVDQEALVSLWIACGSYDKTKGRFPTFAAIVIRRDLTDLLVRAKRQKRTAETVADVEIPARDEAPGREQLSLIRDALPRLTAKERAALAAHLQGHPTKASKSHDSALDRARAKLREAV